MGWPYSFLTLTDEEKLLRRSTIDNYAAIAHYSAYIPPLLALLIRLAVFAISRLPSIRDSGYQHVAGSPDRKAARLSSSGTLSSTLRRAGWWLADDVYFRGEHYGQRDQWLFGLHWTAWLLLLCILDTGHDYLHFTKRLGTIAASQLPIQYALSLKYLNPFAFAFASSHEHVNRWHRVLGRAIYTLVVLHLLFYNYFLIASSIWLRRFFAPVVFCGVIASFCLHGLAGTAAAAARAWSYRIFFVTHLVAAFGVPPLIFFHAPPARLYMGEALFIFLLDFATRKLTTITAPVTAERVAHDSSLIKLSLSIPPHRLTSFQARPGSHVYINIPPGASTALPNLSSRISSFLYNPFTVASAEVTTDAGTLTLVARTREGPITTYLSALATSDVKTSFDIEGPYGSAGRNFDALVSSGASRILLVAGGVGATFAVPIYHALRETPHLSATVQLVWAIRHVADATWATSAGGSLLDDEQVQLYLTGDDDDRTEEVEMSSLGASRRMGSRRPDLGKIVDDLFRQGGEDKVAVLVCGPAGMARGVRERVRPWVRKGRSVWWHDESFGW